MVVEHVVEVAPVAAVQVAVAMVEAKTDWEAAALEAEVMEGVDAVAVVKAVEAEAAVVKDVVKWGMETVAMVAHQQIRGFMDRVTRVVVVDQQ